MSVKLKPHFKSKLPLHVKRYVSLVFILLSILFKSNHLFIEVLKNVGVNQVHNRFKDLLVWSQMFIKCKVFFYGNILCLKNVLGKNPLWVVM